MLECFENIYVLSDSNKGRHKHACLMRHRDKPLLPPGRCRKGAKRARGSANEGSERAEETMEDEAEHCEEP